MTEPRSAVQPDSVADKASVVQVEMCDDGSLAEREAKGRFDDVDEIGEMDAVEERRLVRKIDRALIPLFAVSFIFFYVLSRPEPSR